MVKVKVKGPAIKIQGQWKFQGEVALATEEEYLENKEYLELLEGKVEEKKEETKVTNPENNSKNNEEDIELKQLREQAKDLGIKGAHSMKKETLIAKIEEAEKADNTEDEDPEETDNTPGEGQPEE